MLLKHVLAAFLPLAIVVACQSDRDFNSSNGDGDGGEPSSAGTRAAAGEESTAGTPSSGGSVAEGGHAGADVAGGVGGDDVGEAGSVGDAGGEGGSGPLVPGCSGDEVGCASSTVPQHCEAGQWVADAKCALPTASCFEGQCVCTEGTRQCNGKVPQLCVAHAWQNLSSCETSCKEGECVTPGLVKCGTSTCSGSTKTCCSFSYPGAPVPPTCKASISACLGDTSCANNTYTAAACNGATDCAADQVCCYEVALTCNVNNDPYNGNKYYSQTCRKTCELGVIKCERDAECPDGKTCQVGSCK